MQRRICPLTLLAQVLAPCILLVSVPEASGNFNPLSCYSSFQVRKTCFSETSLFICEVYYLFVFLLLLFVFPLDGKHRLAYFLRESFESLILPETRKMITRIKRL